MVAIQRKRKIRKDILGRVKFFLEDSKTSKKCHFSLARLSFFLAPCGGMPEYNKQEESSSAQWKESWEKLREKGRKLQEEIKKSLESKEEGIPIFAAFSYVPIIGVGINFLFKKDIELIKIHTKNALYLQLTFLSVYLIYWLLLHIPIISHLVRLFAMDEYLLPAIMYLNVVFYIGGSLYGAYKAYQEEKWKTPFLYFFWDNLFQRFLSKKEISS